MCDLDPITNLLTAAWLSRAGLNRKTGLATLTLLLAAEAPDLDMLAYFGGSVAGFQHHRGFTHTFLGAPVVAAVVVTGVYGIYRLMGLRGWKPKLAPRWKLLFVYALIAALVHIFQDFTTSYGVRPFAPFHPKWYSWDIVSIVDPIMLAVLVFGPVLALTAGLVTEEGGPRNPRVRGFARRHFTLLL